jgi:hypothetical protein
MPEDKQPTKDERDEPVKIDLDPEVALKALLKVDPEAKPAARESAKESAKRR